MAVWRRGKRPAKPPKPWVPLVAIGLVLVVLASGGVFAVLRWTGVTGHHSATSPSGQGSATSQVVVSAPAGMSAAQLRAAEDKIANAPMPQGESSNLDPANFAPQMEVNATTPSLALPTSTRQVAGVASGFPKTPQGAVAQLAAMDVAAYTNFSTDAGRSVYTQFAMPGAVDIDQWNPTKVVLKYYSDNPNTNPGTMQASYTPVQGVIKGTVGDGFAVVCVNGRVAYSYNGQSANAAAWDCARMQWSSDQQQWMLAAGGSPAQAPLTWPRDDLSYQAGFRDLSNVPA